MSGFNPDAMDKVFAALTCGAPDKAKPVARMPRKRRKGRMKGIPLAELAGTGRQGRFFGNRDAEHRTQHAADPDVLAANH